MKQNPNPKEKRPRPTRERDEAPADGIIEGRNAVIEALRAGTNIDKIFIMKGEVDTALGHIASTARSRGIVVADADKRKLDGMSRTHAHQGVIAVAAVREYVSIEDILQAATDKGEPPLLVICDELSDRGVRRGPRGRHPQAPERGPDCRGRQDLCRGRVPHPRGPRGQPALSAQGAEKGGAVDLRLRRRRHHAPV